MVVKYGSSKLRFEKSTNRVKVYIRNYVFLQKKRFERNAQRQSRIMRIPGRSDHNLKTFTANVKGRNTSQTPIGVKVAQSNAQREVIRIEKGNAISDHEVVIVHVSRVNPNGVKYTHSLTYLKIIPEYLLPNIRTSDRFRDNVVFVLGYILQSPKSHLTVDQFTTLQLIYNAVKTKEVHMYGMLSVLARIEGQNHLVQFHNLMNALWENLPKYLGCAAKFWIGQINGKLFKPKIALSDSTETLDLLDGIDKESIERSRIITVTDIMRSYDESSKITEKMLGPIFVKLFKSMKDYKLHISQQLFAVILRNLPNPDDDPIFEEYTRFIAEKAWSNSIPDWDNVKTFSNFENPYALIITIQDTISKNKLISYEIKIALTYIKDHFLSARENTIKQGANEIYRITHDGIDIKLLVSLISSGEFTAQAIRLKTKLIQYIIENRNEIQQVVDGMNRYGYINAKDLFLAFLSRLRTRLPPQRIEIHKTVSALLSILLIKRETWNISPPTKGSVTLWTLFDAINDAELDAETSNLIQILVDDLLPNIHVWNIIQNVEFPDKSECSAPRNCLLLMLRKVIKVLPRDLVSEQTLNRIKHLEVIIHEKGNNNLDDEWPKDREDEKLDEPSEPGRLGKLVKAEEPIESRQISQGKQNEPSESGRPGKPHVPGEPGRPEKLVKPERPNDDRIKPDEPYEQFIEKMDHMLPSVDLENEIFIRISDSGIRFIRHTETFETAVETTENDVNIPPVTCLEAVPHPKKSNEADCSGNLKTRIFEPLIPIVGKEYIDTTLRDLWKDEYPTEISFLIALFEKVETNPKIVEHPRVLETINRYKSAINYVQSYVILPLVADYQQLDTKIVWSVVDTRNPSHSRFETIAPTPKRPGQIVLPLVNVKSFLLPVDASNPFLRLLPDLPKNNPYEKTLQPLRVLFSDEKISDYLGKDWNPKIYQNRGALLSSVLRILLTKEMIKTNNELEILIKNYLKAIELPTIAVQIPHPYIHEANDKYNARRTDERTAPAELERPPKQVEQEKPNEPSESGRPEKPHIPGEPGRPEKLLKPERPNDDRIKPDEPYEQFTDKMDHMLPSVNLENEIFIQISDTGIRSIRHTETFDTAVETTENDVNIPSVTCLEAVPHPKKSNEADCSGNLKIRIFEQLIPIVGKEYIDTTLRDLWKDEYPTEIAFLLALFEKFEKNPKIVEHPRVLATINRYKSAIIYVLSNVILPLVADYQQLDTKIVWSVVDTTNPSHSRFETVSPTPERPGQIVLPLVNLKSFLLPVDASNPFLRLLPDLPKNNPYEKKLQPLRALFSDEKISDYLSKDWNSKIYQNRGALLSSVLRILLTNEMIKTNNELYILITNYLKALELPTIAVQIPHTYIHDKYNARRTDEYERNESAEPGRPMKAVRPDKLAKLVELEGEWNSYEPSQPSEVGGRINPDEPIRSPINTIMPIVNVSIIPSSVDLDKDISVWFSTTSEPSIQPTTVLEDQSRMSNTIVLISSIICLQETPRRTTPNESSCSSDLETRIIHESIRIVGQKFIQKILTELWEVKYPTKIAFLIALLIRVENYSKSVEYPEVLANINRYKSALDYVASYVLFPLVIDYVQLNTRIVWSIVDTINASNSKFDQIPPHPHRPNQIVLPLVNPKILLKPIDVSNPFSYLFPDLPEDNPYRKVLQPLTILFKDGHIVDYLGRDWNPEKYPNREALLISVLHTLLTNERIKSNFQLLNLIKNYLQAVEWPTISVQIPATYLRRSIHKYNLPRTQGYEPQTIVVKNPAISVLPESVNPEKYISVAVPASGIPTIECPLSSARTEEMVTLPSIACLEKVPSDDPLENDCQKVLEYHITQPFIETLGHNYIENLLGKDWKRSYPTRISFLIDLLSNAENDPMIAKQPELKSTIKKHVLALKYIASYVLIRLVVDYENLNTMIIWSSHDPEHLKKSEFKNIPPQNENPNVITLPLLNPVFSMLPVSVLEPFKGLLPNLPADNAYAAKIYPLKTLLDTGKIRDFLENSWNPEKYHDRGALLISLLKTLLKHKNVQSNKHLHNLVHKYLAAYEKPSLYIQLPETYIKSEIHKYTNIYTVNDFGERTEKITFNPKASVLPPSVNPKRSIPVNVPDSGIPYIQYPRKSPNETTSSDTPLPSVVCLVSAPSIGNPEDECETDLVIRIIQPLIKVFGKNYAETILSKNWKVQYPTRISFLMALLTKALKDPKTASQPTLIPMIQKYKTALEYVAAYVISRLVTNYEYLDNLVIWSSFDVVDPSKSKFTNDPPEDIDSDVITLPLLNPQIWVRPGTISDKPYANLLPDLPVSNPYANKIKPLKSLFETEKIRAYLPIEWNPSMYTDRGALLITALRLLVKDRMIQSKVQLFTLASNYLKAYVLPSLYVRLPSTYVTSEIHNYYNTFGNDRLQSRLTVDPDASADKFIIANTIERNDVILPPLINPAWKIVVTIPEKGPPSIETAARRTKPPKNSVVLPSVNCLQGPPPSDEQEAVCMYSILDKPLLDPLIEILGENYLDILLGSNWKQQYSTTAACIEGVLKAAFKNEQVSAKPKLINVIKKYNAAIEFVGPYIFLPLIANYQRLIVPNVWLTYNIVSHALSHMGRNPPQERNDGAISLPLVNPKLWLLPVETRNPFANFIPILPANNPFAIKLRPLTTIIESGEIEIMLKSDITPSTYPNRGALYVSALRALVNIKTVQSNNELYTLVKEYMNAILIPSLYVHVPRSYIERQMRMTEGSWTADFQDLLIALPRPQTSAEFELMKIISEWLERQDILIKFRTSLSLTITKGTLLSRIISKALTSTTYKLDLKIKKAFLYYQSNVQVIGAAADNVQWVWIQRPIADTTVDVIGIFIATIPLERLNESNLARYQDLLTYLKTHPKIISLALEELSLSRYYTYGNFMRGFLHHLSNMPGIKTEAKENVDALIPFVRYTGPGAIPMARAK